MTLPTTITVIGAGSASFGENTLSALMRCQRLKGSKLRLVDRNPQNMDIVQRLANRLNREWKAEFEISAYTDPPLTTVRVAKEEMGRLAAERLIALIEGGGPLPAIAPVSGELIVRGSCGGARKEAG